MPPDPDKEVSSETSRLLSELDDVIDQSSLMRDIVNRYQRLHNLESLTGPSLKTRILRNEIKLLEMKLRLERGNLNLESDVVLSHG